MTEPSMPRARKPVGGRHIAAGIAVLVTAFAVALVIAGGSASASRPTGTAQSTAGIALSMSPSAHTATSPLPATTSAKSVTPPAAAVATTVAAKTADWAAPSAAPRHTSATSAPGRPSSAAARPSVAAIQRSSAAAPRRSTTAAGRATVAASSSGNWMTDLVPQIDPDGKATWVFGRNGGWGASDGDTIYIDPDVPADKRFSVLVHEYGHVLQARVYGSLDASIAAMSALTGAASSDIAANESAADCIALLQGATWVNYGCDDALRAAARAILAGHRP